MSIAYGPLVRNYDLDGAVNRNAVETSAETATCVREDDAPDPADAQMNPYTEVPGEADARVYDENGNLRATGAALPVRYRHDYLDRIIEVSGVPALDSGSGVPVGNEFSDDFATGRDAFWVHAPAAFGGLYSDLWDCDSGGFLENDGAAASSAALPRTDPEGDFWWVYARPEAASGNYVLSAYLRITGYDTDTSFDAEYLRLAIDADAISHYSDGTGVPLASAAISTTDNTPYLVHATSRGPTSSSGAVNSVSHWRRFSPSTTRPSRPRTASS